MKAIVATPAGAALAEVPTPTPGPEEILVKVRAASLNRIDLASRAAKDGKIIGMEYAGEVTAVGAQVRDRKVGDRVMCTGPAAFAEWAVTDSARSCPMPETLSFERGTGLTLALQTMHDALVTRANMAQGEAVLIHGASAGVGLMGLQIAKLLGAGLVLGTSTTAARVARLAEFGADRAINASDADWDAQVMQATGGKGVDVIIDQITGKDFKKTMQTAAVRGRIVNVGRLGGADGEFDFQLHALRRISYIGVTFRTRSTDEIRALNHRMLADLAEPLRQGRLSLPLDMTFPFDQAAEALDRMAANAHFGKIVLVL